MIFNFFFFSLLLTFLLMKVVCFKVQLLMQGRQGVSVYDLYIFGAVVSEMKNS